MVSYGFQQAVERNAPVGSPWAGDRVRETRNPWRRPPEADDDERGRC